MGKLVRDKIPEIIEADGKTPVTRILEQDEYLSELDRKLDEEVAEYQSDKSLEEMATKQRKQEERGGFQKRIFWERV